MSEFAFTDAGCFATHRGTPDLDDIAFVSGRLDRYPVAAIARMVGRSLAFVERVAIMHLPSAGSPAPKPKRQPKPRASRKIEREPKRRKERSPKPVRIPRRVGKAPATKPIWRRSIPDTARKAIEGVADKHGVSVDLLVAPWTFRGSNALCFVRQEAYHAVRALTKPDGSPRYSLPQIGAIFGGRDHGTIHHGVNAHEDRLNGKQNRRRGSGSRHSTPPDQRPTTGGARSVTTERLQDCGEGGKPR